MLTEARRGVLGQEEKEREGRQKGTDRGKEEGGEQRRQKMSFLPPV